MLDVLLDSLIDTLKLLPYLFVAFLILEYMEHKLSKKNEKVLSNNKKYGPLLGGLLGAFPQCGFSTLASNLFSRKVITMGTLIAVFLSTSDEMLPIMISEHVEFIKIFKIILIKVVIGIIFGFIIDLIFRNGKHNHKEDIHELCDHEHCHCDENGLFLSSVKHTLSIALFILIANIIIGSIIYYVGEDNLSNYLTNNIFSYNLFSLFGLVPNCASSVIITQLYLNDMISLGLLLSGLLTGSGVGILVLFKSNKNMKENIAILLTIYVIGVFVGIVVDLL